MSLEQLNMNKEYLDYLESQGLETKYVSHEGCDLQEWLSDMEKKIVDWLIDNQEFKLKDFFLADMSWTDTEEEKKEAFRDFFTKRKGKRLLKIVPEHIKNFIIANSI